MKKGFCLFMLLFEIVFVSYSQCDLPYKHLRDFGTDTTAFVMYNFRDRGDCYENMFLEDFIYQYELPVRTVMVSLDQDNPDKAIGLVLFCFEKNEVGRRNQFEIEPYGVRIYFSSPKKANEIINYLYNNGDNTWNKKLYKKFRKEKLKGVRAVIYPYSQYREVYQEQLDSTTTIIKGKL